MSEVLKARLVDAGSTDLAQRKRPLTTYERGFAWFLLLGLAFIVFRTVYWLATGADVLG